MTAGATDQKKEETPPPRSQPEKAAPAETPRIAAEPTRTWRDTSGKFSTDAVFVRILNDQACLRKADGAIARVPLERLCEEDKQYIDESVVFAKVFSVVSGDTLAVRDDENHGYLVRLAGADAPESKQNYGAKARQLLTGKIADKRVQIRTRGEDTDGRILSDVYLDDRWINRELVAEGFAWYAKRQLESPELASAEAEARDARRGLWADSDPVPPWEFRATEATRAVAATPKRPSTSTASSQTDDRAVASSIPAPRFAGGASAGSSRSSTGGSVHVRGYTRKDGTYVRPHSRRSPK